MRRLCLPHTDDDDDDDDDSNNNTEVQTLVVYWMMVWGCHVMVMDGIEVNIVCMALKYGNA